MMQALVLVVHAPNPHARENWWAAFEALEMARLVLQTF
ncbi:hypothetical protein I3760_02G106200 [Carya illinoinensis]|nr:hypothetical protein I3760_02G106200 [Carya illinoinensis]